MPRRLRLGLAIAVVFPLAGLAIARLLGYRLGRHALVRCRAGHVFETTWFPGIKLRAIDLGIARIQRCPVGHHWSLVVPVRVGEREGKEPVAANESAAS